MSNVTKISVALTPEIHALLQQAVASGEYGSSSEVIRDALRQWHERRTLSQDDRLELRRLWSEGIESGPGSFADMASIKREARRRLQDQA